MPMSLEVTEVGQATDGVSAIPDDQLFRIHFENLPGPAYIWQRVGDDFVLIAHNRAASELHFSKVANFLGKCARELQAGRNHDLQADLELCASRGVVVAREVDHPYLETGTLRRLAVSLVPLSSDIVVLHTTDITEGQRTEQALRDSEKKYRMIVDTAHEGIWAEDLNGITTYVNQRAAEMLGHQPDEMLGCSALDFMDAAVQAEARQIRARCHAGAKEQFDFRLRHKNGSEIWVSVAASPITDESGEVTGTIHMMSDITARKRTERALKESEAKIRALLHANPDMIVRVTRDGRYLDVHVSDDRVEKHLPRPSHEFVGRNVRDLFDPEFARQHERHRHRALATGKTQSWEYVRRTGGEDRYVEARFVKGGLNEVVITLRDITQRVELEREVVASSERERTRIGHDLHDGLAQLLIGVKLMLKALTEKLVTEGSRHSGDIERATELVSRAITQTGDLAQGLSPIRKGGSFSDALQQLANQSELLLGVRCHVACNKTPAALSEGSATHLYRIAQEAITNAVKHGNATRIELRCERLKQRFLLSVADNGTGVGDSAADSAGMGMHIMQYRARSIGGELTVTTRPERGTIVKCYYPADDFRQSTS